jgi:hypothetical protein
LRANHQSTREPLPERQEGRGSEIDVEVEVDAEVGGGASGDDAIGGKSKSSAKRAEESRICSLQALRHDERVV